MNRANNEEKRNQPQYKKKEDKAPIENLFHKNSQELLKLDNPQGQSFNVSTENPFHKDSQELLKLDNPQGQSLRVFIRRTLHQLRITTIDENDVLDEVFIRGHQLTASGEVVIRNPAAWIRKTALNYMREGGRKQRTTSLAERDVPDESSRPLIDQLTLKEDLAMLTRALQELKPDEQKLLVLKMIDELSWAEIQRIYASEGKIVSEEALRQRKARAFQHLRQVYHGLKPLSELRSTP